VGGGRGKGGIVLDFSCFAWMPKGKKRGEKTSVFRDGPFFPWPLKVENHCHLSEYWRKDIPPGGKKEKKKKEKKEKDADEIRDCNDPPFVVERLDRAKKREKGTTSSENPDQASHQGRKKKGKEREVRPLDQVLDPHPVHRKGGKTYYPKRKTTSMSSRSTPTHSGVKQGSKKRKGGKKKKMLAGVTILAYAVNLTRRSKGRKGKERGGRRGEGHTKENRGESIPFREHWRLKRKEEDVSCYFNDLPPHGEKEESGKEVK